MQTVRLTGLLLFAAACASCSQPARACALLDQQANGSRDAAAALVDCVEQLPVGGQLRLAPGVYRLERPITIDKAVTISTAGIADSAPGCADLPEGRCATILLDPQRSFAKARTMPVEVAADDVTLSHLIIRGAGVTPERRAECRTPALRPLGGGLRVSGSRFTLRKSVLRDVACYTALEIAGGASAPAIEDNVIGPNGDHSPGEIWSDGVTIHDSSHASIVGNLFIDNTDVQLIFGGCRDCRIERNRFRHSSAFSSGSFAELMLQAWPSTSGNYAGTVVRGNSIDCGQHRRCGYGIMVGSAPWYKGPASGGAIVGNDVSDAMIAINIDALTGPLEIHDNRVRNSGGRFPSDCGLKDWPAVNVAPTSRPYVRGDPSDLEERSVSTAGCLLNRRGG
jgi:hypothetical protein